MWLELLVLSLFSSHYCGGQLFSVTTVYDIGACRKALDNKPDDMQRGACPKGIEGRIHVGKNALGLPIYNRDNVAFDRKPVPLSNMSCDPKVACTWDISGWNLGKSQGAEIQDGKAYKIINGLTVDLTMYFHEYIYICVTVGPDNITPYNTLLLLYLHLGQIHEYSGFDSLPLHEPHATFKDRDGSFVDIWDYKKSPFQQINYQTQYFSFSINGNKLQLYSDLARQILVREWITYEVDNIFFSISGIGEGEQYFVEPELVTKAFGQISSPFFTPEDREICLAIVGTVARRSLHEGYLLVIVKEMNQSDSEYRVEFNELYYEVKYLNIRLKSETPTPVQIIVEVQGGYHFKINRIYSCSVEGDEVELLPKQFLPTRDLPMLISPYNFNSKSTSILPIYYSQFSDNTLEVLEDHRPCKNGGFYTNFGCACPAGFIDYCDIGCGENMFGYDCQSKCSVFDRGCEGLLMCTNLTGCHCASGYTGEYCLEKCKPGYYGHNCREECGRCLSNEPCNIYSGECSSCEPGYYPPNCQYVYVYYTIPPELSSKDYNTITVTFAPNSNYGGYGYLEYYQIQYREERVAAQWLVHSTGTAEINKVITENITSLKDGVRYQVKILLMDDNLNKYDGYLVQEGSIVTKCDVPDYDYKVKSSSNTTSFSFSWEDYQKTSHSCMSDGFEILWKDNWKWYGNFTKENSIVLSNFRPDSTITFEVRVNTIGVNAPFSKPIKTSTQPHGSLSVRELNVDYSKRSSESPSESNSISSSESTSVSLTWNPPRRWEGRQLRYTISYKCVEQPACSPGCDNATEGLLTQEQTSVTLSPLLPFAQYLVTVTPQDGEKTGIYVATPKAAPQEIPRLSSTPPVRTNTSLSVFWEEVPVCSGFLQGYNYELTKKNDPVTLLRGGFTKDTKVSFQNLTASTEYVVDVFIVTVGGWNEERFLSVDVTTLATVPQAVRSLEVYKSGDNMLGVRWAEPLSVYGRLESFALTHSLGSDVSTQTVPPTPCVAWSHLYCHTIEGLKTGRRYNITVSAKNHEIDEYGDESTVSGVTKESLPTAPENLKQLNMSSTSVGLQWGNPNLTNGVLRSFLVSVKETEKYDQDSCCQIYPLLETPVEEEASHYHTEVSGLHPAGTYFVTVSAKTVGLGPSQSLVIHTRPPHLPFTTVPQTELGLEWLPQQELPEVNNSETYTSLIKGHFLIAVFNDTTPPQGLTGTGVSDLKLESLLNKTIQKPYIFLIEYTPDGLLELLLDSRENKSTWGLPPTSYKSLGPHQLVAIQVSEYSGVYNVDLRYSVDK